jgi:hypothetical protein
MNDHQTDDVAQWLGRLSEIEPGPGIEDRALERARNALAGAASCAAGEPAGTVARRVWRHPRLSAAMAAAAVMACIAAGLLAFMDFGRASAFAEVQSAIRQVSWVAFSVEVVQAAEGSDQGASKVMLDLSADRLRQESRDGSQISVIDNRRRERMRLSPQQKRAVLCAFPGETNVPSFRTYFDKLRSASPKEVKPLPDVELGGRKVNRYRVPQGVFDANTECLVFIDPQTRLPVRMECIARDGEGRLLVQYVCKDFSYEPQDPALFDLAPPAGYSVKREDLPRPVEVAPLPGPSTPVNIELRLADLSPREGWIEKVVGQTGQKVFVDPQPIITRKDMKSARLLKEGDAGLVIEVTPTKEGAQRLAEATSKNLRKPLAIVVDGRLTAAPRIFAKISGKFAISGITADEASKIVRSIQAAE